MASQKLTQEELQKINELQNQTQAIVNELGTIEVGRINLDTRYEAAEKALSDVKAAEQAFAKDMQEKYGDGSIDVTTGEFFPAGE